MRSFFGLVIFAGLLSIATAQLRADEYKEVKLWCENQPVIVYKSTRWFTSNYITAQGVTFSKLPQYCTEVK